MNYRLPSYGLFSTILQTSYFFGVPRNVNFSGLGMDVDRLSIHSVAKNNSRQDIVSFIKVTGVNSSAMEHLVPEQIFSTEESSAQGISAVKALAIAGSEGQKVWTITKDNLSVALTAINLSAEIESEIRNAVFAGKVATAHERPISFFGGSNTGYLLIDPDTGAGAYLIASGANGSEVKTVIDRLVALLGTGVSILEKLFDKIGDAGGKSLFKNLGKMFTGLGVFLTVLDFRSCSVGTIIAAALLAVIFALFIAFLVSGLVFIAIFFIGLIYTYVMGKFFAGIKARYCQLT